MCYGAASWIIASDISEIQKSPASDKINQVKGIGPPPPGKVRGIPKIALAFASIEGPLKPDMLL